MDVRILSILKPEHPSTIKAKRAKSTGKPVAVATATEEPKSSGKPEAVTQTSEYKIYHTQLFKSKRHSQRNSQETDPPNLKHTGIAVGHLNEGWGTFKSTKAERIRRISRGDGQESPDELTLRAEEVGTWKSYIDVKRRGGVFSWLILTGTLSVRRCAKASNKKTGESYTMLTKK